MKRTPKPKPIQKSVPLPCTAEHAKSRSSERGWMAMHLLLADEITANRWTWWTRVANSGRLAQSDKIPQIHFDAVPPAKSPYPMSEGLAAEVTTGPKTLADTVALMRDVDMQTGRGVSTVLDYWLFALGDQQTVRPTLDDKLEVRLYQTNDLVLRMMALPCDWGAHVMCELMGNRGKSNTGWFPTPMHVCDMMTRITMGDKDMRHKTVLEPCVGTGAFMLTSSNHSLRLACSDIDPVMVAWTKLAGYLYIPWLVRPCDAIFENREPLLRRKGSWKDAVEPDPIVRTRKERW